MLAKKMRVSRLYKAGLAITLISSIVHCTMAFLFGIGSFLSVYIRIAAIPMLVIILLVGLFICDRFAEKREACGILAFKSAKQDACIFFLIGTTGIMWLVSIYVIIPIAILGIILYWFIMNRDNIQQKRTAAIFLLVLAITAALAPVVIDRVMLRSKTSSVTISRNVPGNTTSNIIDAIGNFNASEHHDWSHDDSDLTISLSNHPIVMESNMNIPCFSGIDITCFSARIAALDTLALEPILYRPYRYSSLVYIMNGTLLSGDINITYSNKTIALVMNGIQILDINYDNHEVPSYRRYYCFMNDSLFSQPQGSPAQVNRTSGYLVTVSVEYTEPGIDLVWEQWYFLDTSASMEWIVAGSTYYTPTIEIW
nr:hypothetical protein [Candidatus Sigynarchaeota archaeon]